MKSIRKGLMVSQILANKLMFMLGYKIKDNLAEKIFFHSTQKHFWKSDIICLADDVVNVICDQNVTHMTVTSWSNTCAKLYKNLGGVF